MPAYEFWMFSVRWGPAGLVWGFLYKLESTVNIIWQLWMMGSKIAIHVNHESTRNKTSDKVPPCDRDLLTCTKIHLHNEIKPFTMHLLYLCCFILCCCHIFFYFLKQIVQQNRIQLWWIRFQLLILISRRIMCLLPFFLSPEEAFRTFRPWTIRATNSFTAEGSLMKVQTQHSCSPVNMLKRPYLVPIGLFPQWKVLSV